MFSLWRVCIFFRQIHLPTMLTRKYRLYGGGIMSEEIQGICEHHRCTEPIIDNHNCLFIQYGGGYGDFVDSMVRPKSMMGLCHKHAHKFFDMLYGYANYNSGSHSKQEPGYSRFHVRWEAVDYGWRTYIFPVLTLLIRNPKRIRSYLKD